MRDRDDLDILLDSSVATYAEPSSGLEQRVLNALAAERLVSPAKSRQTTFPVRRWMPWAVGLAAAACVLLALIVHSRGRTHETQARKPASSQPQPQPTVAPASNTASEAVHLAFARTPKPRIQRFAPAPQSALPKLDVFPTPLPLAPQELTLVAFTARASAPQIQALIAFQQESARPLIIPPIQIPSIQPIDSSTR